MTEEKIARILELIEQETRCEIMARFVLRHPNDYTCYTYKQIEIRDQLRKLVFGSSCLVKLGVRWGLLENKPSKQPKSKRSVVGTSKRPRLGE